MLSTCPPFPWSRTAWEGRKTVFDLVPCVNDFECDFAKYLDGATDVKSFAKLPQSFGFAIEYTDATMNLRSFYPDFVTAAENGAHWLLETKGQETADVPRKDAAAERWCENAIAPTDTPWRCLKVPQKDFEALRPSRLADLAALGAAGLNRESRLS